MWVSASLFSSQGDRAVSGTRILRASSRTAFSAYAVLCKGFCYPVRMGRAEHPVALLMAVVDLSVCITDCTMVVLFES